MEIKAQAIKDAEKKVETILEEIHYGTASLTHKMVKAFRAGMKPESGLNAYDLAMKALADSRTMFEAAIAQPENKMPARPVVNL